MDLYRKIIKSKDISSFLNEKEYKCVSLQAITGEAVKENNKERLKDLVEEINGHLTDLRAIKEDNDPKNKEKCEKLVHQFEECLVKILNKNPSNHVLSLLNQKLEELQRFSNLAIQEDKNEDLKKLVEKIERNLEVVKEMPEVKNARNSEFGKDFLHLVSKYEDLLNIINAHVSAKRRIISEPMSPQILKRTTEGNQQKQETIPPKPKKIVLNEVEEKLKLMRQKRLSRLSTFVDQQSKLSEQRSMENSPKNSNKSNANKSLENLRKISESVEIETAIKSIQSTEIVKSMPFRQIAREKLAKTPEQKVFPKPDEKVIKGPEPKIQMSEFQGGNSRVATSFKNTSGNNELSTVSEKQLTANIVVSGTRPVKEWLKPNEKEIGKSIHEENVKRQNGTYNADTTMSEAFPVPSVRSSFGKGSLTKSFAERQIENAKMQAASEKTKVNLKPSNSTKTTPPRTPTQIRKIFNSFNACVLGSNENKSIEDLPKEFNSPFEQELKSAQLKSTGLKNRLEQYKDTKDGGSIKNIQGIQTTVPVRPVDSPPAVPKRTHSSPRDKTEFSTSRALEHKEFENYQEKVKSLERKQMEPEDVSKFEKSSHGDKTEKASAERSDVVIKGSNENFSQKTSNTKRLSLDVDSVIFREHESNYVDQQPTELLITVKRNSNNIPSELDRYSFSTFRSSTDSLKTFNLNSVENPLYGITKEDTKTKEQPNKPEIVKTTSMSGIDSLKTSNLHSVENPLYGIIKDDAKIREKPRNIRKTEIVKYNTYEEKLLKDVIINCNSLEELLKNINRKEIQHINYVDKLKELNIILKDVKRNVENTLDIDETQKRNTKFTRFIDNIIVLENTISSFTGLKRDLNYSLIDKQLAKLYVEIDQIRPPSPNSRNEKKCLTERLKMANKNLQEKVARNEVFLKNILDEQVQILGKKYVVALR